MDFAMDEPFDFDAFINWPEDTARMHDAAGEEEG